jgi:hypothetical protein
MFRRTKLERLSEVHVRDRIVAVIALRLRAQQKCVIKAKERVYTVNDRAWWRAKVEGSTVMIYREVQSRGFGTLSIQTVLLISESQEIFESSRSRLGRLS